MQNELVREFSDCTLFRQTLQARPPRVVHGTLTLLVALLASAFAWATLTRAQLVVRGQGRVRPVTVPVKLFSAARGESLSASVAGRVAKVCVREGDTVRQGDVLVRLDSERLDNEVGKQTQAVRSAEEELTRLDLMERLLDGQSAAARAKTEAELAQAGEQIGRAKELRESEIRLAQLEVESAERDEMSLRRLWDQKATPSLEVSKAINHTRETRERLTQARLPVDESRIAVLRRAIELETRDHAVKRLELSLKKAAKRAEVEAARVNLANLLLELKQAVIRAPMDGVITRGDLEAGAVLEPGKPVMEIARQGGFRFEAAVPSEEVGHLRTGMPARVKLDAFDYQTYGALDGTVCFISPDSGVAEGRQEAVYTVKILLSHDQVGRGSRIGRVKLGMTGQVDIITSRESLLFLLVKKIRQSITLG